MELLDLVRLAEAVDDTQEYFFAIAKLHEEVTVTFRLEEPQVVVYLGKGDDTKIGLGRSVAGALANALNITEDSWMKRTS